jgi:CubicO group peptidase (beta-lactamase class C family)
MRVFGRTLIAPMHCRVFPAEGVTSRGPEADPRDGGLTRASVDAMWAGVEKLYAGGLHPAIALCVRRRGAVVIDRAIGHLRGNAPGDDESAPKVPARFDSLFNLYSASKAVTAMLVHLLDERGLVHLDDVVAEYIPEFGRYGKDAITIRQILTHRSGIPTVPGTKVELELLTDWERIVRILCDAKPLSVPGRTLAYHALTGGFVLGEIVRRVTGRDVRRFMRDEVLDPLGFATFDFGVAPERTSEVAENAFTGAPPLPPQSWFIERILGVGAREATAMSNDPRFLTAVVPSGNIIGTANEASRFYELLLRHGELDGTRIFDRRTVRRAIAEQSYLEVDSFLGMPVRYGMGFMLGTDSLSPYGPNSRHAFGHIGFTNVIAWADPDRDLAVGLMTSGKPFITPGQLAWIASVRTIARECAPSVR